MAALFYSVILPAVKPVSSVTSAQVAAVNTCTCTAGDIVGLRHCELHAGQCRRSPGNRRRM